MVPTRVKLTLFIIVGFALLLYLLLQVPVAPPVSEINNNAIESIEKAEPVIKSIVVEEPYNITEEYEMRIPYGKKHCVNRPIRSTVRPYNVRISENNTVLKAICTMDLTNDGNVSGIWRYYAVLNLGGGSTKKLYSQQKTVEKGATERFEWIIDNPASLPVSCSFYIEDVPSTPSCFYPEGTPYEVVKKIRTITRYRNVTKIVNVSEKI